MLSKGGVLVRPGEYLIDDGNDKFCAGLNSRLFDPQKYCPQKSLGEIKMFLTFEVHTKKWLILRTKISNF